MQWWLWNHSKPRPTTFHLGVFKMFQCRDFSNTVGVFTDVQWSTVQWSMSQLDLVCTLLKEVGHLILYSYSITLPSFVSLHRCSIDRYSIIIYCSKCCCFFLHTILYFKRFSPRQIYVCIKRKDNNPTNITAVH